MAEKKAAPSTAPHKSTKANTASKSAPKSAPKKEDKKNRKPYKSQFSYSDPLLSKFINCLMKDGKKTIAQRIMTETLGEMYRRGEDDPLKTFEQALKNSTPSMEVRAKRIGGAVYQIPIEVTPKRQKSLCTRWVLAGARKRKGKPMFKRLADELIEAANETGFAYGKREDAHKMAQSNKAFAHLARY